MKILYLPVVVFILLVVSPIFASTWYVNPEGTGDFPTIQEAVDGSSSGDEIVLDDGVYMGVGNRDIEFNGKVNLTIRSGSGNPVACVIDCQGTEADPHRGFCLEGSVGASSVIESITIRNGFGPVYVAGSAGGAILCVDCEPTVSGCIFSGNEAERGGAIFCGGWSWAVISGCTLTGNAAQYGMAIYINSDVEVTVENCTILDNSEGFSGGDAFLAIYCFQSSPRVAGCTFSGNRGSIGAEGYGEYPVLENSIITNTIYYIPVMCAPLDEILFTLSCVDIWGNEAGDWVDDWPGPCIAGQYGMNGNISENPMFCDPVTGDFTLDNLSPCAPGNHPDSLGCGLIGSQPVGCAYAGIIEDRVKPTAWGAIKSMYR